MRGLKEEHEMWSREGGRLRRLPRPRNDIDIPEDITLNILSRLPVESVLECRLVYKTWSKLPLLNGGSYFASMHLRHRLRLLQDDEYGKMSFIWLGCGRIRSLYYAEYNRNDKRSLKKKSVTRIRLPLPGDIGPAVGSCNGLVCLSVQCSKGVNTSHVLDPVYICNPVTGEYVKLPRCVVNENDKDIELVYGFGYHPITNEYKVVRIHYSDFSQRPVRGRVQVYTLGSGSGWRNKGEITYSLRPTLKTSGNPTFKSKGVLVNGALHWLARRDKIVAFDLADEEFHLLPTPPISSGNWYEDSKLWVFEGLLCLVHVRMYFTADLWLLKKNEINESSNSSYYMKGQEHQSWSWSKDFTLELPHMNLQYVPLALTKSGEILLLDEPVTIVCYDPKTATSKRLGKLGESFTGNTLVSYFKSFVSLKALGENASKPLGEHANIKGTADGLDGDTKSRKGSRSIKRKRSINTSL